MGEVVFPDIELFLVTALQNQLDASTEPVASGVFVGVKKPRTDTNPYPPKTVIIRSDGGADLDHVRRSERVGINIWCPTYGEANDLARLVAALIRGVTGTEVKNVRIGLHPTRIDEDGPEEHRYLTAELVVKGTNLP